MPNILVSMSEVVDQVVDQCPSCKVIISRNEDQLNLIRPQRTNCPYCGSNFDLRSRRASMKGIIHKLRCTHELNFQLRGPSPTLQNKN